LLNRLALVTNLAGAGIAYLLWMAVTEDLAAGDLMQILPQHPLIQLPRLRFVRLRQAASGTHKTLYRALLNKAAWSEI
jgi:DNA-binding transcriptional LysR family regulator